MYSTMSLKINLFGLERVTIASYSPQHKLAFLLEESGRLVVASLAG